MEVIMATGMDSHLDHHAPRRLHGLEELAARRRAGRAF